jgi:hypothetical protein
MNQAAAVRKELHDFIDAMPDSYICALKLLFALLAGQFTPVIETDLSAEERQS